MIADNTGKALEPLKIWLKNHYKLRYRERQRIEAFVAYYAGTPAEPMPFVGRTEWLQQLDQWLAQNQSRFLLLSGSAGRGKSALLLHWLARIIPQQPDLAILFLPISIRFETSNELEGLRLLLAAVCDYFSSYRLRCSYHRLDTHDYRNEVFSRWEDMANKSNQRYLLVIDGIDESTHHGFLKKVLPTDFPANLHLLLSARHPPEETDGTTWLSDLGITGEQLELPPLTQSAIAEAIIQLGCPLDELAEQQAFVEQLYRLTDQGDPLLLTLWIGQIWQNRETASDLTADKLQQLKPSFAGFYKIWLAEQQKIWKEQSIAIHPSDFNRLMQVLASAYGPLLLENELVDLLQQIQLPVSWDYIKLRNVFTTASRLVVGDGENQGFSLIHPRLNDYFQAELAKNPAHQRQVHEAYLNWGAAVVAHLNQNQLMPDSCPHYLLDHYTAHIAAVHLKPALALEKYWLPLLEGGWHQAWEAYEGAWNGFLSDLQQVIQALRQYNQACYDRGERIAMKLAAEVRCALIRASIHTLSQNIPTELIIELFRANIWSLAKVERMVKQFVPVKRVDCLISLSYLVLPEDKLRLLQDALEAVEQIVDEEHCAKALMKLAPQLSKEPYQSLLQRALNLAEQIQDERWHDPALKELDTQLGRELHQKTLQQAWEKSYQEILQMLRQICDIAEHIQDEESRTQALKTLASQLDEKLYEQMLQQSRDAWDGVEQIQDKELCTQFLTELASQLNEEQCQQGLQKILDILKDIQEERWYVQTLITLAPLLGKKLGQKALRQALDMLPENKIEEYPVQILMITLASQLEDQKCRQQVLQKILDRVKSIQDGQWYAWALITLASQLNQELRKQVLQQALCIAKYEKNEASRAQILIKLLPQLDKDQLNQVLDMAKDFQDKLWHAQVLIALASQLNQELHKQGKQVLQQALGIAKYIKNEARRAQILITLIPHLDEDQHFFELNEAYIQNEQLCVQVLIALAPQLDQELSQQVLQKILDLLNKYIQYEKYYIQEGWYVQALITLAPQLDQERRQNMLQQAWKTAEQIWSNCGVLMF